MKIDVNNITLNYKKIGKGRALIFLHGNGEDLHIFDQLTDKMKQHYTVYAIDSRNHGLSSKMQDLGYDAMAQDVFCFIKELNLHDVSLVGFSDGAIIGLLLSMQYRDLFSKMVLLGVNLRPSDFKKHEYDYIVRLYNKTKDPLVKLMLEQPQIDLSELKRIDTPTLVVAAQNDVFYRKTFRDIVAAMPNASLRIIKGHDHGSYIIGSDVLYPDLIKFLE